MSQFHDFVLDEDVMGQDGRRLLDVMAAFSPELGAGDVIERAVAFMYPLFNVDRVGMFLVDEATGSLVLKVSKVSRGIRTPIAGLAGCVHSCACPCLCVGSPAVLDLLGGVVVCLRSHVATTGEVLNIPDVYDDPRFNPAFDKKTGYRSRSMLCVPVIDPEAQPDGTHRILAVLQLINKADEQAFNAIDQKMALAVRVWWGIRTCGWDGTVTTVHAGGQAVGVIAGELEDGDGAPRQSQLCPH